MMHMSRSRRGFSLVEMIGVLAIIAILAVVIVPRVFSTIASSRLTSAIGSINSIKSAVSEFAGRYGTVPTTNANSRIDDLLLTAGYLEGRFVLKVGTQPSNPPVAGATWAYANGAWTATGGSSQATQTRITSVASTTATPGVGTNYRLNGTTDLPTGSRAISAVIAGITGTEARELSLRIDGDGMSAANATAADTSGKVTYAAPNAAGTTTVYVYIAHQ
jgi:prepilin-type N-terminal cleavage/methylation domain-containing protein